jgi:hypothetical protein
MTDKTKTKTRLWKVDIALAGFQGKKCDCGRVHVFSNNFNHWEGDIVRGVFVPAKEIIEEQNGRIQ